MSNKKNNYPKPSIDDCINVSSSTECTGLVQANNIINNEYNNKSFNDIYKMPNQKHTK